MKTILITGAAGFIGHALSLSAIHSGFFVVGIDNLIGTKVDRYIKNIRLGELISDSSFSFYKANITEDLSFLDKFDFDLIVHLAARAGVRQSMNSPEQYIETNIIGFTNILEYARRRQIRKVIYASSSSVYGEQNHNIKAFKESDQSECHKSVYAMTKKSNEMLAYIYSNTYHIQTIGLRFFSVYGPYGRPDMAPWIFAKSLMDGRMPTLYNSGKMYRDFTFVDDVVSCILSIINANQDLNDYQIYNIGASNPHSVLELFEAIKNSLGISGSFIHQEAPSSEPTFTSADMSLFKEKFNINKFTDFHLGIKKFCIWFEEFYSRNQNCLS